MRTYESFYPREINGKQTVALNELREAYVRLSDIIEECCPPSRERSIAITNLEQSAMWGTKAITHAWPPVDPVDPKEASS